MTLILILAAIFFVLPVLAYMVMKFGTVGYLRARRREKESSRSSDRDAD